MASETPNQEHPDGHSDGGHKRRHAKDHRATNHHAIAIHHAPIGVMGDHLHQKGGLSFSYRYMRMSMQGSRIGANNVSPDVIATTIPNRFFGQPMQPPTLRVVPTDMTMDMHMVGVMYGATDWLTLMAMGMLVDNGMDHLTYQGPTGTTVLGGFRTESFGFGDTKLTALVRLFDNNALGARHSGHINLGFSVPTGSITRADQILTPAGATPTSRLPYPMQLGSGTVDLNPGVTYSGASDGFSWGAQYKATIRTGRNEAGYTFGDAHQATSWVQYGPASWIAFSGRTAFRTQDAVDGVDPAVVAPVQTADPDFQGGERLDLGVGVSFSGQGGAIEASRIGVEVVFPVYQNLNGPQLETDWQMIVGFRKKF